MVKKIIYTNNAPKPIGVYSQAVISGNLIFTSGQLGINPITNQLEEGIEAQTHRALKNLVEIAKEANTSLDNAIKMLVLLKDINDFKVVNQIYQEYFSVNPPARSAFQVANLPMDALIEIEAIIEV